MIRILLCILFSFMCCSGFSQIISSLSVSEDTIFIGDEIDIYYRLTAPKSTRIIGLKFSNLDSLDSLMPTSSADTSSVPYYAEVEWDAAFMNHERKTIPYHLVQKNDLGKKYEYKDTFRATFWDIGFFEILHPHFILDSSALDERIMRLQTPTVLVSPPGIQNTDTTSVILPIKDIIVTEKSWKDNAKQIAFIALGLLLALLLLYLYSRSKIKQTEEVVVEPPKEAAHVIALRKLNQIAIDQEWKKEKVKKYQSDLTYTIREYLENRYEINALESTTDEISRALAKNNFSTEHETDLREILQIADLVKFAKAKPTEDINEKFLDKAKQFVEDTKEEISIIESEGDAG